LERSGAKNHRQPSLERTIPGSSTEAVMFKHWVKLINDGEGATAIEYGLIAALIAVAAIGALRSVGTKLDSTFTNASNAL
jgi:pilus assembly protein Flp/PilA